jgi:hypothetical protein
MKDKLAREMGFEEKDGVAPLQLALRLKGHHRRPLRIFSIFLADFLPHKLTAYECELGG